MERSFNGYEYTEVMVRRDMLSVISDAYESFGWKLVSAAEADAYAQATGKLVLKFRRDRKIRNKAELVRLQSRFDACLESIEHLEIRKTCLPSAVAYGIGILGVLCTACAVFCAISADLTACILTSIPGALGLMLPHPLHSRLLKKRSIKIMPMIDEKYDEIFGICEKAKELTDK